MFKMKVEQEELLLVSKWLAVSTFFPQLHLKFTNGKEARPFSRTSYNIH